VTVLEDLRERWGARLIDTPIHDNLEFTPEGLVLGAGVILAKRQGVDRPLEEKDDARLAALLSAAYAREVSPRALRHVRKAMQRQHEGDSALAAIHLALARLGRLREPSEAARRLFMAEAFLDAGVEPADVLDALGFGSEKDGPNLQKYTATQLRVPKGSGRPSGQWTKAPLVMVGHAAMAVGRELNVTGRALGAAAGLNASEATAVAWRQAMSLMARLSPAAIRGLIGIAADVSVPTVVLGVLFIPTNKNLDQEGPIPGRPGWRYHWNSDETVLRFGHDGTIPGPREIDAQLDKNGKFKDAQGHAVGAILPDGTVAIQLGALSHALVDDSEPNLCPAPSKDRPGSRSKDKDYEDFVKRFINPDRPTPRGLAVVLVNPVTGSPIHFDDCQHATGVMIEAKGAAYARLLKLQKERPNWGVARKLIAQARNQVAASQGRPIIWFFASREAAMEAQELADKNRDAFGQIQICILAWNGEP
jgi:hypothetical protein